MALLLVGAYFLAQWHRGLWVDFQNDDVMNLHYGWTPPLSRLLYANVVPTSFYRPFVSGLYRLEFFLFGWDPLPYRIVTYTFFAANFVLVWYLGRLLTRRDEIGILAALLFSFHPNMYSFLINNGTIYDAVAAFFYLTALCLYLRARQRHGAVSGWYAVGLVVSFVCGLNSKEFVATLPAVLIAWELVREPRPRELRRYILPLALCAFAAFAIYQKTYAEGGLYQDPLYRPQYTLSRAMHNLRSTVSEFSGLDSNSTGVAVAHGTFLIAALAFRKRFFVFLLGFTVLSCAPLLFIPWRGLFALYLQWAGWSLGLAAMFVHLRDWLVARRWPHRVATEHLWQVERVLPFLAVATALLVYARVPDKLLTPPFYGNLEIRGDVQDYTRLRVRPPRGGKMLLLNDRCGPETWTPYFVARLFYKDRELVVHRVKKDQWERNVEYDLVLDLVNGHLQPVSPKNL